MEYKRRAEESEKRLKALEARNAELTYSKAQMAQRIANMNGLHKDEVTDPEPDHDMLPARPPAGFTAVPFTQTQLC